MTPVAFDRCFGWLHQPRDGAGGDVAVLICPGLMQDALLSHRSLRLLADQLAEAGYWALRFDYPGTGDSCGDADMSNAGGHWAAWRRSVDAASDWLRATTGARRLVLCGLRFGATLAAVAAAQRDDVVGLGLFAPVVRGHSYMRQILVEAQLQSGRTPVKDKAFDYREFRLGPATLAQIAAIDLRKAKLRAGQKVAMFVRSNAKPVEESVQAWTGLGVEVACQGWAGLEPLLRHNSIDEYTLADFTAFINWLRQSVPVGVPSAGPTASGKGLPEIAALHPQGCIETPLLFGGGGGLFGMLCRPDRGATDTVVLICNAGRDPHYGGARQAVSLARRLAAGGIASLRMDFAGLGDSIGPPGRENVLSHMFETDRVPDIHAALDALELLGFRRFAAQGLCAGAYHAFHGALADPRITTLLLVNIPLFSLPGGNVLGYLERRGLSIRYYLRKLARRETWAMLLDGKMDVVGTLRAQYTNALLRIRTKTLDLARWLRLVPVQSFAGRAMATLSKRGVRILFLFSPGEAEIEAFAREFGPTGAGLRPFNGVAVRIIQGMDHDLSKVSGRYTAETFMIEFVAEHRPPEPVYPPRHTNAALA
ncbi:MAG: serine aminopeptidase domain-containing protein [Reyranellales bacterium]